MKKMKFALTVIVFGLHGFQCTTNARSPETPKNQIKNKTT